MSNTKRPRILCFITGSRADFGLLRGLIDLASNDPDLSVQIIATGMHLDKNFGSTSKEIEEAGYKLSALVPSLSEDNSNEGVARSIGEGIVGFSRELTRLRPDLIIVLGDRYEILAGVTAALIFKIPVAHLHGGELTEGAYDDSIRHSITKMSHLHFVSTEEHRKRVLQLGENPQHVMNFGAVGLDSLSEFKSFSRQEFWEKTGYSFGSKNFLITLHPETLSTRDPLEGIDELLKALESFPSAHFLFTGANADSNGMLINQRIQNFVKKNPEKSLFTMSLGRQLFLSAIRLFDVVVGNSSAGLVEVPVFKKPTVNIGFRQNGRERAISVIDCDPVASSIATAIGRAMSPEFQARCRMSHSPQWAGGKAAERMVEVLKNKPLDTLFQKRFCDL